MDDDRFIPYVWRLSWWRERLPATIAVVLALAFAYGGSLGWWVVEERSVDGQWRKTYFIFPEGDRTESNPGENGIYVCLLMLLPCTLAWLWAPLGGHAGRLATAALFAALTYAMLANLPKFISSTSSESIAEDTVVFDALLERIGWEWHGFDGTRSGERIGGLVVGERDIVALRERVQPGATLSLASAVGGFMIASVSIIRDVQARRAEPRPSNNPTIATESDVEASGAREGLPYTTVSGGDWVDLGDMPFAHYP